MTHSKHKIVQTVPLLALILFCAQPFLLKAAEHQIEAGAGINSYHGDVHSSVQYGHSLSIHWEQDFFSLLNSWQSNQWYGLRIFSGLGWRFHTLQHNAGQMNIHHFQVQLSAHFRQIPFLQSMKIRPFLRVQSGIAWNQIQSDLQSSDPDAGLIWAFTSMTGWQIHLISQVSMVWGYAWDSLFFQDGMVWNHRFLLSLNMRL